MSKATATLFLDTRRLTADGIVRVIITYQRKQKLRTTGVKAMKQDWEILLRSIDENGLSNRIKNSSIISIYNHFYKSEKSELLKAKAIIEKLGNKFTFEEFFLYYDNDLQVIEGNRTKITDLIIALQKRQEDLISEEQVSLAGIHHCIAVSLIRFLDSLTKTSRVQLGLPTELKNTELPFSKLSVQFLEKYEKWMLREGRLSKKKGSPTTHPVSLTTISIYVRNIRTIYKEAIRQGIVNEADYPFSQGKYVIPNGEGKKLALTKVEIEKIINYETGPGTQEEQAKSLWVFSYLSNGMNLSDICRLKWKDVDFENRTISFIRTKTTKANKGKTKTIVTNLFPLVEDIIAKIGNQRNKNEYVFPFLNLTNSEIERKHKIRLLINLTNDYMNRIGKKVGITANLTTYVARHSFATILARNNVPHLFISQSLGHANIKTTENYLGSFEKGQSEEYLKLLL